MIKPSKPSDFIGKTGIIAKAIWAKIPALRTAPDAIDRCYLFTGPPGTGKTSLAELLALELAGHKLAIEQVNGQSCTIELVRQWQLDGQYMPMYGKCRVQLVDEIDAASLAACNQLRTYLDKLPRGTVFIATTNKPIKELQEQLQSRFKVHYFTPIPTDSIATWLTHSFGMAVEKAVAIASGAQGNVRAAKADALNHIEVAAALAA